MAVRPGERTLYLVEQVGRVRAIRGGRLDPTPVVDISEQVTAGGEQGLLGLAFSPDGRYLYLHYTDGNGDHQISELAMGGQRADKGSQRSVLHIDDPFGNHNGGQLAFGPDRRLYIAFGDGGGGGDPEGNGQSLDSLLGKILRIDPRPAGGRAYQVPVRQPVREPRRRPARDLGLRAAQPVAVLVRRRHRRPVDRRRRPERLRGGRLPAGRVGRAQLRLEPARGPPPLQRRRPPRRRRRPGDRVRAGRRRLHRDRRLRLPRPAHPRPPRRLPVRRLLRRLDQGGQDPRRARSWSSATSASGSPA